MTVLVAGMRWGRVKKLTFDPTVADKTKRVTVTAVLNDELQLRDGFTIEIRDSTLLGGHQLAIDPGPAEGAAKVQPWIAGKSIKKKLYVPKKLVNFVVG